MAKARFIVVLRKASHITFDHVPLLLAFPSPPRQSFYILYIFQGVVFFHYLSFPNFFLFVSLVFFKPSAYNFAFLTFYCYFFFVSLPFFCSNYYFTLLALFSFSFSPIVALRWIFLSFLLPGAFFSALPLCTHTNTLTHTTRIYYLPLTTFFFALISHPFPFPFPLPRLHMITLCSLFYSASPFYRRYAAENIHFLYKGHLPQWWNKFSRELPDNTYCSFFSLLTLTAPAWNQINISAC